MRDQMASVVTIETTKPRRLSKRVTSPAAKVTPGDDAVTRQSHPKDKMWRCDSLSSYALYGYWLAPCAVQQFGRVPRTPRAAPKETVIAPGTYRHCAHPRLYDEPRFSVENESERCPMNYTILRRLACVVQAAMFVLIAGVSLAGDLDRYKVVDGIGIYLGVMPTDLIADHPLEHTEGAMHGGVPLGEHHHHVMVALFEIKTGERITDAEVKANVREVGLAGQVKKLEPMTIAGALTYGNYFELRYRRRYLISVQVRRPGSPKVIEARFEYYHY